MCENNTCNGCKKKTYTVSATKIELIEAKSKKEAINKLHEDIKDTLDVKEDERIPIDLEFEAIE